MKKGGQRHGFTITTKNNDRTPLYVVNRNLENNIITVSKEKPITQAQSKLILTDLNYIAWEPQVGKQIEVQTRYRQKPAQCTIVEYSDTTLTLQYNEDSECDSEGQSCVLYDGTKCCGGGIIR